MIVIILCYFDKHCNAFQKLLLYPCTNPFRYTYISFCFFHNLCQ